MKYASQNRWTLSIKMFGHVMPMIRILLLLRKFRVEIEAIHTERLDVCHWQAILTLGCTEASRKETILKKIARFYDVVELDG